MTDTTTFLPAAGWYPDPTSVAPFRWWNGAGWTEDVLQDARPAPASPVPVPETVAAHPTPDVSAFTTADPAVATPADAAPRIVPAADGSLPSRRSLRASVGTAGLPAAPVAGVGPSAAPESAPTGGSATASIDAAASAAPATASGAPLTLTGGRVAAPYVPLNPLATPVASPASPASPAGTGDQGFSAPAAWIANAPSLPQVPGQPIYGQPGHGGVPSGYGPAYPAYATPNGRPGKGLPRMQKPYNGPARSALALAILSALQVVCLIAVVIFEDKLFFLVPLWTIAGFILALVGLSRAKKWRAAGLEPLGYQRAVVALVILSICLLVQGAETGLAAVATVLPGTHSSTSSLPATGTSPVGTGSGTGTGTGGSSFAAAPEMALPSASGDGTYTYSQVQAQNAISASYVATLKVTPTSVVCPVTEPIIVSENFTCTVTVPGGTVTTATVTIVDAQGHAEVTVR